MTSSPLLCTFALNSSNACGCQVAPTSSVLARHWGMSLIMLEWGGGVNPPACPLALAPHPRRIKASMPAYIAKVWNGSKHGKMATPEARENPHTAEAQNGGNAKVMNDISEGPFTEMDTKKFRRGTDPSRAQRPYDHKLIEGPPSPGGPRSPPVRGVGSRDMNKD